VLEGAVGGDATGRVEGEHLRAEVLQGWVGCEPFGKARGAGSCTVDGGKSKLGLAPEAVASEEDGVVGVEVGEAGGDEGRGHRAADEGRDHGEVRIDAGEGEELATVGEFGEHAAEAPDVGGVGPAGLWSVHKCM
jgi:hypothetical protein